jgi:hypothetical protein
MSNTASARENWLELAASIGYPDEAAMWQQLYVVEKRSIAELAKTLGYGTACVQRRLRLANIDRRERGGAKVVSKLEDKLFHLDQRFVALASKEEIAALVGGSTHSVYRIRRKQ